MLIEILPWAGPLRKAGPLSCRGSDARPDLGGAGCPGPPASPVSFPSPSFISGVEVPPPVRTLVLSGLPLLGFKCQAPPGLSTSGSLPQASRQARLVPPPPRPCQCPAAGGSSPFAGATAHRAASGRGERVHGQDRGAGEAAKPGPKGVGDPAGEVAGKWVGREQEVARAPKNRPSGASRLDTSLHPGKRIGAPCQACPWFSTPPPGLAGALQRVDPYGHLQTFL